MFYLPQGTSMELTSERGVQIEPLAPSSVHLLLAENYVNAQREYVKEFTQSVEKTHTHTQLL